MRGGGEIPGVWRKGYGFDTSFCVRSWSNTVREIYVGAVIDHGAMLAELGRGVSSLKLQLLNVLSVIAQHTTSIREANHSPREPPIVSLRQIRTSI